MLYNYTKLSLIELLIIVAVIGILATGILNLSPRL
jgi:Tfp pilus assembly protein PilE